MIDCLHPYKVYNRSLGRDILVSCGKCLNCLSRVAKRYTNMCAFNERHYKYTMFVTLTYSKEFLPVCVPLVRLFGDLSVKRIDFINITPRLHKYYNVIYSTNEQEYSDFLYLFDTCAQSIGYCAQKDVQNFLKRFRKHLNNFSHEKNEINFSYFSASEYGERRFRPHFHLLFYFDSEFLFNFFGTILHKSWQFGRIDYSLSRGGTSSYVARYINSVSNLPQLLQQSGFKCCKQHSSHFSPISLVTRFKNIEDIQKYGFRNLVSNGVEVSGETFPLILSSYDSNQLLPKLPFAKYSFSNIEELCFLYKSYYIGLQYYASLYGIVFNSVSELALEILSDLESRNVEFRLIKWFRYVLTPYQNKFDFIYRFLLTSKKFLTCTCKGDLTKIRENVELIISFYSLRSLNTLKNWYDEMDKCISSRSKYLLFFYDNFLTQKGNIKDDYYSLPDFHRFLDSFDDSSYFELFNKMSYYDIAKINGSFSRASLNQMKLQKHKQLNNELYEYNESTSGT